MKRRLRWWSTLTHTERLSERWRSSGIHICCWLCRKIAFLPPWLKSNVFSWTPQLPLGLHWLCTRRSCPQLGLHQRCRSDPPSCPRGLDQSSWLMCYEEDLDETKKIKNHEKQQMFCFVIRADTLHSTVCKQTSRSEKWSQPGSGNICTYSQRTCKVKLFS